MPEVLPAAVALTQLGGVAPRRELLRLTSARRLRTALANGEIVRAAQGWYRLPDVDAAVAAAGDRSAVVSHLSAALHHGWPVKFPPERPQLVVPRGRKVTEGAREGVDLRWRTLGPGDTVGIVTSPLRTVIDCARDLPFDEALAVADSALRCRAISPGELDHAAASARGPGARKVRRVADAADWRKANPFESVLHALAIEAGLAVEPQVPLEIGGMVVHPDLLDRGRRLVLEADSWTHHASHEDHDRDCARYNAYVAADYRVLRFTWRQAMLSPAYVRHVLGCLRRPPGRTDRPESDETAA